MRLRRPRQATLSFTEQEWDVLSARPDPKGPTLLEMMACPFCGGFHSARCPRVSRIEFQSDGRTPLAVEFYPWGEWPDHTVAWPDLRVTVPTEEEPS